MSCCSLSLVSYLLLLLSLSFPLSLSSLSRSLYSFSFSFISQFSLVSLSRSLSFSFSLSLSLFHSLSLSISILSRSFSLSLSILSLSFLLLFSRSLSSCFLSFFLSVCVPLCLFFSDLYKRLVCLIFTPCGDEWRPSSSTYDTHHPSLHSEKVAAVPSLAPRPAPRDGLGARDGSSLNFGRPDRFPPGRSDDLD